MKMKMKVGTFLVTGLLALNFVSLLVRRDTPPQCEAGSAVTDAVLDQELVKDTGIVRSPMGLTFRTKLLNTDQKRRLGSGVWEASGDPAMLAIFKSDPMCDRPIFVDGGAAFGYYTHVALKQQDCREVQAFNPHPRFASAMRINLEDNWKTSKMGHNVCINQIALSDHEGTATFGFGYGEGISDQTRAVNVTMSSLDMFFKSRIPEGKKVLLVKLDVEGAEFDAMKGAQHLLKNCRVKHWVIGIHKPWLVEPIANMLKDSGYTIHSKSGAVAGQPNGEIIAEC